MSTIFILIYPFIMLTHLPLAPRPGKDLFFIPILHFFKVCIDSSRGFCLQACIYHALIISTPHYLHSLSPCSSNIQQLTVQCIILYSHIDGLFQYFSFSNIFFTSPISSSPLRQTH
jgi:hypothetical protein